MVLEDIRISGCNGSAVVIQGYSESQFGNTNSNVLRNVQVDNNNGMDGAALHIGARANVRLEGCHITGNIARASIVYAAKGSTLIIANSMFTSNNATSVAFYGTRFNISGSKFVDNNWQWRGGRGGLCRCFAVE